jgi:hypothetical protein
MNSQAFKIWTEEGSLFAVRLDQEEIWYGIPIGPMTVIGHSKKAGRPLHIVGKGAAPRPGGRVTISDKPQYTEIINGEEVHCYDYETILKVEEVPVPDAVLRSNTDVV